MSTPLTPTFRTASAADLPAIQAFVAELSVQSRSLRFFAPLPAWPAPLAEALQQGSPRLHVVLAEYGGRVVGMGEQAVVADGVAELALLLADVWQGRGVGSRLLQRLLDDAGAAGLREARVSLLAHNTAMRCLARQHGFELTRDAADAGLLHGRRRLTAPAARHAPLRALWPRALLMAWAQS